MPKSSHTVIVAGAGLGGLTAALCLLREGFAVRVLEQAAALGEVGAGVQISANGARVLHGLGLGEALDAVAFLPEAGEMRHWQSGETLVSRPLGAASRQRFGFPYYHLHRADLHGVLAQALAERAPDAVTLSAKVTEVEQDEAGVRVRTAAGDTVEGDVLVGADGIHSAVRAALFGRDEPAFTGCVAWRATVSVDRLPAGHVRPVATNWVGRGGHFVHYYLRRGELVNCVGVVEQDAWQAESWSNRGDPADFAADFAGWHDDVQVLIAAADSCFRWGLFDRAPMPAWSSGRVTLLGDACHPMLPFMAQGAVMAIEDGLTLARCLALNDDAVAALARYQALRLERASTVQRMSRGNIDLFHAADRPDLLQRLEEHRDRHLWLYGFDVADQDFAAA